MSDAKALNLSSLVSKKTRRAKERLLQNFGKADRTTDEMFEVYQLNFNRQQSTALNLQKHVKHYLHCLRELHEASKSLNSCVMEMHEKEWPKHDTYENNTYESEHINEDLEEKLKESVLVPLEQYLGQFSEMREKISKRGRKLVDYDSQRHSFETLQQNQSAKQPDDAKLSKHRDQLDEARRVYESLNSELHDELPALYDNRLPFIITVFQRLFSSHITYHSDNLAVHKGYLESVEHLAKATERGSLTTIKPLAGQYTHHLSSSTTSTSSNANKFNSPTNHGDQSSSIRHGLDKGGDNGDSALNPSESNTATATSTAHENNTKHPVLLHKVRATYKYLAEDEDELSFEAGEIIQVIEYANPDEQEDGWLMGIKESDGQKGLFPANFTKEI